METDYRGLLDENFEALPVSFPLPFITNIDYAGLDVNETRDITITGGYFTEDSTVVITNGVDSIQVNSVTCNIDDEMTVNITTFSVTGFFDVTVDNGTGRTEVNGIEVISSVTVLIPDDGTTVWTTLGLVAVGLGSIIPATAVKAWDKGGSFGVVPSSTDCTLVWNITATPSIPATLEGAVFGFAFANTPGSLTAIEYGIRPAIFGATRFLQIREGGGATVISYAVPFVVGDELKIIRVGSGYTYYHNTILFHTSTNPSTNALYFSCVINEIIGANNISITF